MATICIIVDDVFPGDDDNHIYVNYHWCSSNGSAAASDGGSGQFTVGLSSILNQSVIDACVAASADQGVTIGLLDRKVIKGFV